MTNNQTSIATDAIAAELLRMKEGAVRATREHDVEYYDGYASDDCMAIMPYGTFGKAWLLNQLRQPQASFQALGIEDERVMVLSDDCGLVYYTRSIRAGRWQSARCFCGETTSGGRCCISRPSSRPSIRDLMERPRGTRAAHECFARMSRRQRAGGVP
jgi:hypothetical protein